MHLALNQLSEDFARRGWVKLPFDAELLNWSNAAHREGCAAARDPAMAHWWQCEGTWFVGVDALANDETGQVSGVALSRRIVSQVSELTGVSARLHPAQVSIIKPGYPKPRHGESEAAFNFRLKRDAAHVDGLLLDRASGRRVAAEFHGYVLGIPLNSVPEGASPMVVWEGSHLLMQELFQNELAKLTADERASHDLAPAYKEARKQAFESCSRVEVSAQPGEAYVLHRHLLHGVAPWQSAEQDPMEGRMIAYFRPHLSGGVNDWLGI